MRTLIFATNNQHKVDEISNVVGQNFNVVSLKEAGIEQDIPEPYDTLEENASTKTLTIFKLTNQDCFADDTGFEVEALNGEPGVKSARYAGEGRNFKDNVEKVLTILKNNTNRKARFRTIISLMIDGVEQLFEGICTGKVTEGPKGENGFGYDPIFIPDGSTKTFAQMSIDEKNLYSHREKATAKLLAYLSTIGK